MKRLLFFAAGCALLVALFWLAGAKAIGAALAALGAGGLLLAGLIHLPVAVLMALALWYASGKIGPQADYLAARFIRDGASDILPFSQLGGFAAGLRVLVLRGQETMRAGLAVFLDLVMEFAAKLPYMAAGLMLLVLLMPRSALVLPLAVFLAVLLLGAAAAYAFRVRLGTAMKAAAARALSRWGTMDESDWDRGLQGRRLWPSFGLHVLCWFLGALETWVVFALLGHPVTVAEAVVIDSLANTIRTFGFLVPAAAGVQEGAYVLICAALGIEAAPAMAFSLARRAREILIGLPSLAVWNYLEAKKRLA